MQPLSLTFRLVKGSRLSFLELDNNFKYLEQIAKALPFTASAGITFSNGNLSIDFRDFGTSSTDVWSAEQIQNYVDSNLLSLNGIIQINGLTATTQNFSTLGDSYINFGLISSGYTHSFSTSLNLSTLLDNISANGLTSNGTSISIDFNDSGTSSLDLWSADKIQSYIQNNSISSLNGLSSSIQSFTISGDNYIQSNITSNGLTHSFSNTLNLNGLLNNIVGNGLTSSGSEISILTGNGLTISSDTIILNFNDSGTTSNDLWSANKIANYVSSNSSNSINRINGLTANSQFLTASGDAYIQSNITSIGSTHSFSSSLNLNGLLNSIAGNGLTNSSGSLSILTGNGLTNSSDYIILNYNDTGTTSNDLWSANKIINYVSNNVVVNLGTNSLQASGGVLYNNSSLRIDPLLAGKGLTYSSSYDGILGYTVGVIDVNVSKGITISSDTLQINPSLAGYGLTFNSGVVDINFNWQQHINSATYSEGILTLNRENGSNITLPIIPDWTTATYYKTKDLVISLYENEYRIFRALSNFISSGTAFPGSQSIAIPTNSYTGQWQEVSPLRGNMSEVTLTGTINFQGSLTPPIFTGGNNADVNNYNPTGLANTNFLRISAQNNNNITGLQSPNPIKNQGLYMCNVGTSSITLKNESLSSSASNRFLLGSDKNLQSNEGIMLIYDDVSLRWRSQAIQI